MSKTLEVAFAKFAVAFVAVAMMLSLVAPAAQAQTTEELQTMINDLLAQVAALSASTGGSTMTSSCTSIPAPLTMGAQNANVTALQNYLIAAGQSIPAGATGYFGGQTQAALAGWQAANGVAPAVGYYGPITMAAMDAKCVVVEEEEEMTEEEEEEEMNNDLSGGEASLESFEGSDGDDTDLEEGQENAPVAEFEFDIEDGDVQLSRMDVAFIGTGDEKDPWDTFETISLWVDGDMIAEMDVDDEDDWNDNDPITGADRIRFTGLDQIFREDDTAMITVGVTVQGSVDGTNNGENWEVFVPVQGIRGRDSVGIDQYIGDTDNSTRTESIDFTIEEEGGEDELKIQSSSNDPDSTTIPVELNTNSDFFTVFAFDLDTDDSVNDIEVETIAVAVVVDNSNGDFYSDIVNDAMLVIDGEEYDDFTVSAAGTATATLTFDIDNDLVIDAGEEVTAELQLEFKKQSGNYAEGQTVFASASSTLWEAAGADDLTEGTQLSGSATGDVHTLRTEGAIIEFVSSTETLKANTDSTTADDEGVFTIKVDVTAFETDLFINKSAGRGTTMGTLGANFTIEDQAGALVASNGTSTAVLTSTADTDGTRFKVSEGETETFTLTVNYDALTSGFYQVQFHSVNWAVTNVNPTIQQVALPASDFESESQSI